ncbi:MAG: T9SS type A sorting domain-containing protein [Candidatus Marinimicrobia bacterium]|jgi:hypothetical protein|nr:T9SS type A sorting domain-containing protein [Candidatus Neomarinimicrobiota bacterium]MBT3759660.1 T9SS type A sorting domain-containing protein [Candidatus Neomarinimicrobiota bacterium]MBT3894468.1 T9SS type A sorting domain-containing protein [Candidatus Neomarinimicrobiota bacterium]MBT4851166.1 T9SS type A sorting domain-containing protein [Candidatus Neomarinimicrobiota bacterium]MBT5212566.1 T9SS type A sorting domain-containing protein [Candidatus Neomarinimicrobiota bacterium]
MLPIKNRISLLLKSLLLVNIILIINPVYSQDPEYFQVNINPTGESHLVVFDSEIVGLNTSDELGIFDLAGLLSELECTSIYGELLTGAGVWTNEQLDLTAIGSIDNCALDGVQLPGYVNGNDLVLRIWNTVMEIEYPVNLVFSTGGDFGALFTVIEDILFYREAWYGNEALNPMTITILASQVADYDLMSGDEIAVYSNNICVGRTKKYIDGPEIMIITASADLPFTEYIDGFLPGEEMTFKIWDSSDAFEETWISIQTTGDQVFTNNGQAEISLEGLDNDNIELPIGPERFSILSSYPNPFNDSSIISYQVNTYSEIDVKIYNVNGGQVDGIHLGDHYPGLYNFHWQPGNIPSGNYILKFEEGDFYKVASMMYLK